MKNLLIVFKFLLVSISLNAQTYQFENVLIPSIVLEMDAGKVYTVEERMPFYHVQGLSMVAYENGKVVWSKSFGYAKADKNEPVLANTRFQVASISKAVTALGVLKLAETYHLNLDVDVNQYLKSWKVANNQSTTAAKVSIRGLLNHTAGINIDGFTGYFQTEKTPSLLLDVLNGKGATPKIEVVEKPNSKFSYSGGGYVILAKLIEDVSGKSFEDYMQETIFQPLKMVNSSFNQYPTKSFSYGYDQDGTVVKGGWKIMPELAPNGLWTTAGDLALFCIAIQNGLNGSKKQILSSAWINQMLHKSAYMDYGLGLALKHDSLNHYFFHAGQNPGGYTGVIIGNLKKQSGLVVLTNSEDNHLLREIINGYTKVNNMGYARGLSGPQEIIKTIALTKTQLAEFTGTYRNDSQKELEVTITTTKENTLAMNYQYNGYTAILHPIRSDVFYEIFTGLEIHFSRDTATRQVQFVERRGRRFVKN